MVLKEIILVDGDGKMIPLPVRGDGYIFDPSTDSITIEIGPTSLKPGRVLVLKWYYLYVAKWWKQYPIPMLGSRKTPHSHYKRQLKLDPCAYCGGLSNSVDHIVPRHAGGENTFHNLTGACTPCNSGKSNKGLLFYLLTTRSDKVPGWWSWPKSIVLNVILFRLFSHDLKSRKILRSW